MVIFNKATESVTAEAKLGGIHHWSKTKRHWNLKNGSKMFNF